MSLKVSIIEQPNVIDDHLLDIIGNEFKFSHEKGLPEWLKNSVDAYIRREPAVPDEKQYIVLNFRDARHSEPLSFECVDFCGMTSVDIDSALKRWGDPKAASRGLKKRTYGGHGNGGKFYMRQMFGSSYFLTYRDGRLSVFGFNENKKYGFARELRDKACTAHEALTLSGLEKLDLPSGVCEGIQRGRTGFTVVRGIRPRKIRPPIPVQRLCEKLKFHAQARKLIQRKPVRVLHNGRLVLERLEPELIDLRPGYENLPTIPVPRRLVYEESGTGEEIEFSNDRYPAGHLKLLVAKEPFGRNSRLAELNCIDILGGIGVIGSYRIHELGPLKRYAQAEFIFGECYCPILEDPDDDCVKNDREKLIDNHRSRALLRWVADKVNDLGGEIEGEEARERRMENLRLSDQFNKILNSWKNQFIDKLLAEVLGGPNLGSTAGGPGTGGSGGGTRSTSKTKGGTGGEGTSKGGGAGDMPKKGSRHPIVLLSSHHPDPFDIGSLLHLTGRHNPVYQRPKDVAAGIYWINTSRPLATAILGRYGAESPRWREYHFQRFVDIIVMEALHAMEKNGTELTFDLVENKINEVIKAVHDNALHNLEQYLL